MDLRALFDVPVPAIVLAEEAFGETGGKTANGIVLHSEIFDAHAIVDSTTTGQTPTDVLHNPDAPDIPIVDSVGAALNVAPESQALVIGVAPAGSQLPDAWVEDIETAIQAGCDVVSGLHVFLSEREHWRRLAADHGSRIIDVRKPPEEDELRVADGSVDDIEADVVCTMGTDCAIGKRTTTFELYKAAQAAGYDAGWVATGQTGIMVGAQRGIVIDRVPADFAAGVVEDLVIDVASDHELVFVEGQAALSHRAYSGVSLSILHGAWPDAVVLADDPDRSRRTHFESFTVNGVANERLAIEHLADTKVVAISTWGDSDAATQAHDIPAANVYDDEGPRELLEAIESGLGRGTDANNSTPRLTDE